MVTSELFSFPRRFLAGSIRYVPRHPFIFHQKTIAENIAFEKTDESSIFSVGYLVGLDTHISLLSKGYHCKFEEAQCGDLERYKIGIRGILCTLLVY